MRMQNVILMLVLTLAQVLVFNNLVLFHTAVCFIFIYIILRLPLSLNTNWLLTLSFLIGFVIDIFSDTPGLCALSSVLLAVIKKPAAFLYISKDDKTKGEVPSIRTMGWGAYSKYLLTTSAFFCLVCFAIDFFNFADVVRILVMAASSTLFTFIILICLDCVMDSINTKLK